MTISADLISHIITSNLFDDYYPVLDGIRDDIQDFRKAKKFLTVRRAGGGKIDPVYGEPIYQVMVGGSQQHRAEFEQRIDDLVDWLNSRYTSGAIANIFVSTNMVGPIQLSENRVYFMIVLQLSVGRKTSPVSSIQREILDNSVNVEWPSS